MSGIKGEQQPAAAGQPPAGPAMVSAKTGPLPLREGLFMITCAARTGSSMLVNLLQSHPDVMCHMEIFNPKRVEGFSGTYRARLGAEPDLEPRMRTLRTQAPEVFLYKIAFDGQGRPRVGFKFKYEELLQPMFSGARAALMADCDIRIVHLRRRNLLARYLSWWVANHVTGVTMVRQGQPKPAVGPVRLDPAACIADFDRVERHAAFVARMFADHPVLDITYEALTGTDATGEHARLQAFLGVRQHPLKTVIAKLSELSPARTIENYAELENRFRGTPYAHMLMEAA
jgi:LPS sulfotransferase NodH